MSFVRITRQAEPIAPNESSAALDVDDQCPEVAVDQVVTTSEELEAFYIVRSILRQAIQCARIQMKKSQFECSVLLDGDRGKPICRFHFHDMSRRVVFFAADAPQAVPIDRVNELYDYAQDLRATVMRYDRDFPPTRRTPDREILA